MPAASLNATARRDVLCDPSMIAGGARVSSPYRECDPSRPRTSSMSSRKRLVACRTLRSMRAGRRRTARATCGPASHFHACSPGCASRPAASGGVLVSPHYDDAADDAFALVPLACRQTTFVFCPLVAAWLACGCAAHPMRVGGAGSQPRRLLRGRPAVPAGHAAAQTQSQCGEWQAMGAQIQELALSSDGRVVAVGLDNGRVKVREGGTTPS